VTVQLTPGCKARIKLFDFDFSTLEIKGRNAQGNTLTRYPIKKISLKETGKSTLGAIQFWFDEVTGKLNNDERGQYLGEFDTGDLILTVLKDGHYELSVPDTVKRFPIEQLLFIEKFDIDHPISCVYYDGEKDWTMAKRFLIETLTTGQKFKFISEHPKSALIFASSDSGVSLSYLKGSVTQKLLLDEFIEIKGWKAKGNKISDGKMNNFERETDISEGQISLF
jgi:topoisomerase-4 subunit A